MLPREEYYEDVFLAEPRVSDLCSHRYHPRPRSKYFVNTVVAGRIVTTNRCRQIKHSFSRYQRLLVVVLDL